MIRAAMLNMCARIFVLALLLYAARSDAHDVWSDGRPIPPEIRAACCSVADAHFINPEQVHTTAQGWKVDGYDEIIPYGKDEPSPDGSYWLFYATYSDGSHSHPFCWFVPPRSF